MPTFFNFNNRKGVFMIPAGATKSPTPAPPSFSNTKSLAFDGVDEYVDCGDSDNLSFGDGSTDLPFSISAWVKMDDATNFGIISKSDNTSGNSEYLFYTDASNRINLLLYSALSINRYRGRMYSVALTEGVWMHLAATYDGQGGVNAQDGIKIYLNGVRVDDTDISNGTYVAMPNGSAPLKIAVKGNQRSNGNIDETAIFSSELTSEQISTIATAPSDLSSLNPTVWYRMGDNSTYQTPQILMPENTNKDKVSNYSLSFDGVDDYISVTANPLTDFTVSFWINPSTSVGASFDGILGQGTTSPQGGILRYVAYDGTASVGNVLIFLGTWTTVAALTNGEWSNVILTYDSTLDELKSYKNGSLYTTISNPNFSGQTTDAHSFERIGMRNGSTGTVFNGAIDEVAVWDSALTDISSIYNSGEPTTIPSGAVAHWRMGEQAKFTNNWLVPNSALNNYSKFSFNLDGVDDTIDLGLISELNNTTAYTLSMWVNPSVLSGLQYLFALVTSSTERVYIFLNNNIPNVGMSNGTNTNESFNSAPLTVNTWHHLAVVFDGTQTGADRITFYLNGVAETTTKTTWDSTTPTFVTNAFLSNYAQFGLYYFNGKIDETAIYDTALNSTQISELYNSGEPTTIPSGAVAHWRMGEDATYNASTSEWTIPDQVGSNDGTSSNTMALDTLVGEAPNYFGGGISDAMTIEDRVGDAPNSSNNAVSYNMEAEDINNNVPT